MKLRSSLPILVFAAAWVAVGAYASPTGDIPMEGNAYIGSEACVDTVSTIPLFDG